MPLATPITWIEVRYRDHKTVAPSRWHRAYTNWARLARHGGTRRRSRFSTNRPASKRFIIVNDSYDEEAQHRGGHPTLRISA
jgi:hypothetical protein